MVLESDLVFLEDETTCPTTLNRFELDRQAFIGFVQNCIKKEPKHISRERW